jgi:hypothetical protein
MGLSFAWATEAAQDAPAVAVVRNRRRLIRYT